MKQSLKRQKKENLILDAAEQVFFPGGYEKAKMEDVAKACGMSKASLYFYFKSKEDIYMAITHRAFEELIRRYYHIIDKYQHLNGADRVKEIFKGYAEFSLKFYHYHEALFYYMSLLRNGELVDDSLKSSIFYKKIQGIQNLPIAIVVDEIDAGKADGSIKSSSPSLNVYLTAWSLIAGFVKLSVFGGVGNSSMNYVDLDDWKNEIFDVADKLLDN
ncbi:MAG: TetR/AcrR family transcriptional regulator [Cyclobacteriaceae bacterium]